MAGISVGASDISKLAAGETEATKVSLGPIDVWTAFTPIIENNVARTNYPVPYGATGAWVTLQAAGGAGGEGATGLWTANSGGGGGGRIERTWVPVSEMGATYSVVQGKGGKGDGGDSVFSSGGVNLTAKGGKKGSSGATTVGSSPFTIPGGAGGTYSVTGMSGVRVYPGSPGGDATNTVTNPGASNANNAGAGGGAGGPYSSDTGQTPGGAGGSSTTVTGGAGGTDSVKPGVKPDNATIPNGGAGGGGGAGAWFAAGGTGGDGGRFGGGGGGAGCGNTVATAGKGGDGFTRIEWTAESIEYRRVFVAVTEVNQTTRPRRKLFRRRSRGWSRPASARHVCSAAPGSALCAWPPRSWVRKSPRSTTGLRPCGATRPRRQSLLWQTQPPRSTQTVKGLYPRNRPESTWGTPLSNERR